MRILHIGPVNARRLADGLYHAIRGLVEGQAQIGLEVGLLSSLPLAQGAKMENIPGVCLLTNPHKPHYNPWFVSKDWVARIREEFGVPDLVIFHSTYIPFQVALAKRCRQVGWPYIFAPGGGITKVALNIKKTKKCISNILFFRSFVKHAVAVHAQSESEAIQAQSHFNIKQIIISPNGVDERLLEVGENLAPADLGDFADGVDLMLGYVGRIDVYIKGIDLLLEAMAILKSRINGFRCKLFMVGPFPASYSKKDKQSFYQMVRSLGLEDNVKLLGPKFGNEKWSYFLACDIFVHTSRTEAGICLSLLEAMALGRPFLVTPGTNMAGISRECGGWVSAADPNSFADMILEVYKSRQSLNVVGQRLKELVRLRYTWRKVAEQLKEEYSRIIALNHNTR